MKKRSLLFCFIILIAILVTSSCTGRKLGSDDVHFQYFWWEDDNAYHIKETNVEEKTLEDNWEMIDVVIPTEYNGKPVTHIGWDSFRQCQILRSVTIPEGITGIGPYTFFDCNSLEGVHLPKSINHFFGGSFASCNSLKEVTVDPDNPWLCSIDGVVYTKDQKELVFYPPGKADEEFVIPEGCLIIDRYAFAYCENLKRIIIPSTVTDISYESILFCKGLEGVVVDERNAIYSSFGGNLYSKDGEKFLRLCVSVENLNLTLPEGVIEVADCAAYYGDNLIAINLPKSLTSIGEMSFLNCENLTNITIPENVTVIGDNAFYECTNLTDAIFEDTSGWKGIPQRGKFQTIKQLDKVELDVPMTAAKYLTEDYSYCEWHREN